MDFIYSNIYSHVIIERGKIIILLILILITVSCSARKDKTKVVLLALDGLSMEIMNELSERGDLPAFSMLGKEGVTLKLKSFGKMLSPVVWTTVITGKMPEKHGIDDFIAEEQASGKVSFKVYSYNRKTKALWNIIQDNSESSAIINWWGSYPCENIDGKVITMEFIDSCLLKRPPPAFSISPPSLKHKYSPLINNIMDNYENLSSKYGFKYIDEFRGHFLKDHAVYSIFSDIYSSNQHELYAVYFWQLDQIQHIYYSAYDISFNKELLTKHGANIRSNYCSRIITDYYSYYDQILKSVIDMIDHNTILVVISDHGFGMIEEGIPWHLEETYGFVYSKSEIFRRGKSFENIEMADFAPTILHLLGHAVAKDMDGRVLTELLDVSSVLPEITYIDTYDHDFKAQKADDFEDPFEDEHLHRLRALGYIN